MRTRQQVASRDKHKKVIKAAKGMQHGHRRSYRNAKQALIKALRYAYRDRRARKRTFRQLWIKRINNALQGHEINYSRFINALQTRQITLDRKILSELAVNEPAAFSKLVEVAKATDARSKEDTTQ